MANNYTQFSETFQGTKAQLDRLLELLKEGSLSTEADPHCFYLSDDDTPEDHPAPFYTTEEGTLCSLCWEDEEQPFIVTMITDEMICFFTEESGDIEPIVEAVARLQQEDSSVSPWSIEAAFTCSAPRAGEFGGMVGLAAGGRTYYMSTNDWVTEKLQSLYQEGL